MMNPSSVNNTVVVLSSPRTQEREEVESEVCVFLRGRGVRASNLPTKWAWHNLGLGVVTENILKFRNLPVDDQFLRQND